MDWDSPINEKDFLPYYALQEQLREKVIREDCLPATIQYVAGVDVAYNDLDQRMVGAIVVLDALSLELVDQATHEMDITFPYLPGLFSFRELPPLLEAYKKLRILPNLIVCDAQGIAHPKGLGMASHLGIELDRPTIGCAKKRLFGNYEAIQLGAERGSSQPLMANHDQVGVVLRTQTNIKPMFVSLGHKISLETAIGWVLKLCPIYRLPETTRRADQLVNALMKDRT
ncbi:MAG: deoxyribonuclease V [Saprospiraceae bacterium]